MTVKAVRLQQEVQQVQQEEDRRRYWLEAARTVQQQNPSVKAIADRPVEQIAEVLKATQDGASQRSIASTLNLHHETVRRIQQAAATASASASPAAVGTSLT